MRLMAEFSRWQLRMGPGPLKSKVGLSTRAAMHVNSSEADSVFRITNQKPRREGLWRAGVGVAGGQSCWGPCRQTRVLERKCRPRRGYNTKSSFENGGES